MDPIALREARDQILLVHGDPTEKVTRDTDIERSITATGQDVNAKAFHPICVRFHRGGVTWIPASAGMTLGFEFIAPDYSAAIFLTGSVAPTAFRFWISSSE